MSEKTFEIYPEIMSEKVYFNNRFGIKIAGDLFKDFLKRTFKTHQGSHTAIIGGSLGFPQAKK